MRLGWVVAPREIMESIVIAKQASDLHSNYLSQRIAYEYLTRQDIDDHIRKIRTAYKNQRDCMIQVISEEFPESVTYTKPQGGMFLWITLPEGCSSMEVFENALEENVAVLPVSLFISTEVVRIPCGSTSPILPKRRSSPVSGVLLK